MKYTPGPYTQTQLKTAIDEIEISLTNRYLRDGAITDAAEKRYWREAVEKASFGRNTVMYDDQGYPSVMVAVPLFTEADVLSGSRNYPHPAFIVNGTTKPIIYISKYQNIITGSGATMRALSLKGVDPKADVVTHDYAVTACKQKGTGWHCATNAEYAALALLCKSQGFMPRGNNSCGKDYAITSEKGTPSHTYDSSGTKYMGRVATGSGPVSWTHDGTPFGVYDLNGNVYEWAVGMRTVDGEIQNIPNNNAADNTKDLSASSTEWKAIMPDGSLVAPGTEGTLKYDAETATPSGIRLNTSLENPQTTDANYLNKTFETVAAKDGVTIPNMLKLLALMPIDVAHGADYMYVRNNGERCALRGGYWNDTSDAGVFCLYLNRARSSAGHSFGFRSAFVQL